MKIYDKAQWHIDAGENEQEVINRFATVFQCLYERELLSDDGKEIFEIGIDDSASLNERMVTDKGNEFLNKYYDDFIELTGTALISKIESLYAEYMK